MLSGAAAIIMFAVIYFSLSLWMRQNEEAKPVVETVAKEVEMVDVVVAKSNIAPQTVIKENMVQLKKVSAELVPEGTVKKVADVVNTFSRTTIFAGDLITEQKIYTDLAQAGFVGTIPSDCRAISISVNNITGVAGFAKPGDYVDLLLVEKNAQRAVTNVLLQNILLLGIDQNMRGNMAAIDENGNSNTVAISNPSIATFALRPEEALKLISASKLGEIYLMLRPFKPHDMYIDNIAYSASSVNATPVTPPQENKPEVVETPPAVVEPPPAPVVPQADESPIVPFEDNTPPKPRKIEIIQGDQIVQTPEDENTQNVQNAQSAQQDLL